MFNEPLNIDPVAVEDWFIEPLKGVDETVVEAGSVPGKAYIGGLSDVVARNRKGLLVSTPFRLQAAPLQLPPLPYTTSGNPLVRLIVDVLCTPKPSILTDVHGDPWEGLTVPSALTGSG